MAVATLDAHRQELLHAQQAQYQAQQAQYQARQAQQAQYQAQQDNTGDAPPARMGYGGPGLGSHATDFPVEDPMNEQTLAETTLDELRDYVLHAKNSHDSRATALTDAKSFYTRPIKDEKPSQWWGKAEKETFSTAWNHGRGGGRRRRPARKVTHKRRRVKKRRKNSKKKY